MSKRPLVYVIDDNPIVQELLDFRLSGKLKCIVSKFSDANSALRSISQNKPDLIVLDYNLDNSGKTPNGLGFLEKLNQMGHLAPTIVLSGQTDKMIAVNLIRSGAVDYVSKDSSEFLNDIEKSAKRVFQVLKLCHQKKEQNRLRFSFLKRATQIIAGAASLMALAVLLELI